MVLLCGVSMEGFPDKRLGEGHAENFLEGEFHIRNLKGLEPFFCGSHSGLSDHSD